jgi:hypothetical protein
MPSPSAQTITLSEGQAILSPTLREIARGNPIVLTCEISADDLAAWDEWWLELYHPTNPNGDPIVSIRGVPGDASVSFSLTSTQTNLDLDGDLVIRTRLVVFSLDSTYTVRQTWFLSYLPIVEAGGTFLAGTSPLEPSDSMYVVFLRFVTGFTGGGAENLDGVTTVGLTKPFKVVFDHPIEGEKSATLLEGSEAEVEGVIIYPVDRHETTNVVYWQITA